MPSRVWGPAFTGDVMPNTSNPPSRLLAMASAAFTTLALVASSAQVMLRLNSTPRLSRPSRSNCSSSRMSMVSARMNVAGPSDEGGVAAPRGGSAAGPSRALGIPFESLAESTCDVRLAHQCPHLLARQALFAQQRRRCAVPGRATIGVEQRIGVIQASGEPLGHGRRRVSRVEGNEQGCRLLHQLHEVVAIALIVQPGTHLDLRHDAGCRLD